MTNLWVFLMDIMKISLNSEENLVHFLIVWGASLRSLFWFRSFIESVFSNNFVNFELIFFNFSIFFSESGPELWFECLVQQDFLLISSLSEGDLQHKTWKILEMWHFGSWTCRNYWKEHGALLSALFWKPPKGFSYFSAGR